MITKWMKTKTLALLLFMLVLISCMDKKEQIEKQQPAQTVGSIAQDILSKLEYVSTKENDFFKTIKDIADSKSNVFSESSISYRMNKSLHIKFVYVKSGMYLRGISTKTLNELRNYKTASGDNVAMANAAVKWLQNKSVNVTVPYNYYMLDHLVTNEEYNIFTDETGYETFVEKYKTWKYLDNKSNWKTGEGNIKKENHKPVTQVSFLDAMAYASWLSKKIGLIVRLPTLEEWELAVRNRDQLNKKALFYWGNDFSQIQDKMNCADISLNNHAWHHKQLYDKNKHTSNMFDYEANNRFIYDANGNVWTWLYTPTRMLYKKMDHDYDATPYKFTIKNNESVEMRGGCFYARVQQCNLLAHMSHPATDGADDIGFRLVIVRQKNAGL